jgi:hypothetical protein
MRQGEGWELGFGRCGSGMEASGNAGDVHVVLLADVGASCAAVVSERTEEVLLTGFSESSEPESIYSPAGGDVGSTGTSREQPSSW